MTTIKTYFIAFTGLVLFSVTDLHTEAQAGPETGAATRAALQLTAAQGEALVRVLQANASLSAKFFEMTGSTVPGSWTLLNPFLSQLEAMGTPGSQALLADLEVRMDRLNQASQKSGLDDMVISQWVQTESAVPFRAEKSLGRLKLNPVATRTTQIADLSEQMVARARSSGLFSDEDIRRIPVIIGSPFFQTQWRGKNIETCSRADFFTPLGASSLVSGVLAAHGASTADAATANLTQRVQALIYNLERKEIGSDDAHRRVCMTFNSPTEGRCQVFRVTGCQ